MNINSDLLKKAREESNLSQSDLAANLDISRTQISRYEKQPGSIPAQLLFQWLQVLGLDPSDVFQKESKEELALDPGKPYESVHMSLQLLDKYIEVQAPSGRSGMKSELPDEARQALNGLKNQVEHLRQKPNVMMAGGFDTGKSYLANTVLGRDLLPTSFQPATRVVTVVRHVDDRPEWQDEDVWLFSRDIWSPTNAKKGSPTRIDISVLNDHNRCAEHRILAGSPDLLKQYGVHRDDATEAVKAKMKRAHTAVVYTDAPLLHACTLIDLPGFGDRPGESGDQEKAIATLPYADLILYTSRMKGHLGGQDLVRISSILRSLRSPEAEHKDFPTLGNLFIIGTHADRSISDSDIETVRQKSIGRLNDYLKTSVLRDRSERTGREITTEDMRAQWFPFWSENVERSRPLVERLSHILGEAFPAVHVSNVNSRIESIQDESIQRFDKLENFYDEIAEDSRQKKAALQAMKKYRDEHRSEIQRARASIKQSAQELKQATRTRVGDIIDETLRADAIKADIEQTFSNKREAKDRTPTLVLEQIGSDIKPVLREHTAEFVQRVQKYLNRFETPSQIGSNGEEQKANLLFDAQTAFAGGIAELNALGALSVWASQLGTFRGYMLTSKGVSPLSPLGISLANGIGFATGSAAAAAAIASALPIVGTAIGLGAVAAFSKWRLLSSSWEERLARKVVSHFEDESIKERFLTEVDIYWDDTQDAFEVGAETVEKEFKEQVDRLEEMNLNEKEARNQAKQYKAVRDFYAGLPW